ncbi:MAG TPA: glycosyltransferase family 1 protein [Thermoleophilaceae bacterium]|nr:glycosyltransferase family 1 protein [Thermoleophilaceae bacterium]
MTRSAIGIDARAATEEGAGGGRFVRELVRALAKRDDDRRYVLYARRRWEEPLDERFRWREVSGRDPIWHVRTALAANRECGAFLSTNSYLTTWFLRVPSAAVVFDLVAFDPALRPQRRSGLIERLTLPLAARRSAALIAISQATADDLVERFPTAAGKTTVAPLGTAPTLGDEARELPRGVPEGGFILAVGTLEPRKNLPRLVAAYERLPRALQDAHPLVVTGRLGWDAGETMASLRALGDRAVLTGFVPDAELGALYRHCNLFVYPSLGEGFGLPVLEAMAAGAPVLTSSRSSLPEVGGDAAAYCDPTDTAAIAAALEQLLRDPPRREELSTAGPRRAAQFSWDRTADVTVEVLERISREAPARRA